MEYLSAYDLEYKLLPILVGSFNKKESLDGDNVINILSNIGEFKKNIRLFEYNTCEIDLNNISISTHYIDDSLNCILYEFPDPHRQPLAKYALIVFEKNETEIARYFTLEKSVRFHNIVEEVRLRRQQLTGDTGESLPQVESFQNTDAWVLGETNHEQSHMNYGYVSYKVSPENFIKDVLSKFYNKNDGYRTSKLFLPETKYKPTIFLYIGSIIFAILGGLFTFSDLQDSGAPLLLMGSMISLWVWQVFLYYDSKRKSDVMFVNSRVIIKWMMITVIGFILGSMCSISFM